MKKLAPKKLELKNLTVKKLTPEEKLHVKGGGYAGSDSTGCGGGGKYDTEWPLSCSQKD